VVVHLLLATALGLLVLWVALVVALRFVAPDEMGLRDAMRLLPDLVRLTHRLARDRTLPRGIRVRLVLLLAYLALPIDLVPDFVPVIGYADDAVIVAFTLRSVIKRAGYGPVEHHWPGTPDGLAAIYRLTRTRGSAPAPTRAQGRSRRTT
jgi:uncharacterized membrane protein YkvA (DUF1232 family)